MEETTYLHTLEEIPLSTIVKDEYRLYQIYTLMDRAIPYLKDGLKPSQRRILFTLWRNQNKGLMKVTGLTGLVLNSETIRLRRKTFCGSPGRCRARLT